MYVPYMKHLGIFTIQQLSHHWNSMTWELDVRCLPFGNHRCQRKMEKTTTICIGFTHGKFWSSILHEALDSGTRASHPMVLLAKDELLSLKTDKHRISDDMMICHQQMRVKSCDISMQTKNTWSLELASPNSHNSILKPIAAAAINLLRKTFE